MTHKIIDRCKETTGTTGTGNLTLTGPVAGCVSMASALTSDGDTSWFCAENGTEWEVFLGTRVNSTTLSRSLISSSTGSTVNFTAPPVVFSTVPASRMPVAQGPAFSAYLSSPQTVSSGAATKVAFNAESFDIGGCFDSTTNRRFTPTVPGVYSVSWLVTFRSTGAMSASTYMPTLLKNGQLVAGSNYANCAPTTAALGGQALVFMNGTTDYLEVYGVVTGTGTLTFGGGVGETLFSAFLVTATG